MKLYLSQDTIKFENTKSHRNNFKNIYLTSILNTVNKKISLHITMKKKRSPLKMVKKLNIHFVLQKMTSK